MGTQLEYQSVIPYLTVDDAKGAIDFYKDAFGAEERGIMAAPDGKIAHASLQIGDLNIMLSDKFPEFVTDTPKALGGTTVGILLYVSDADAAIRQAVNAGATVTMEPEDQFWGDRFGAITDPYGHAWQIATHIEDVSPEEMEKRQREFFAAAAASS
jgi:PhnB protein